jgi:tetratricopeptide (TPR) repeat protein
LLSDRKDAIRDDLDDEIDYMRSERSPVLGGPGSYMYRRGLRELREAEAQDRHDRALEDVLRRAERLNDRSEYAEALSLLLEGIREYGENRDVLQYVFETVLTWRKSYFTCCFARHYVTYLLARSAHKEALNICETCFEFAPEFLLANPLDVIPLAKIAEKQQRYATAHSLVRNARERYGDGLDLTGAGLMEARLLAEHLEQRSAAKEIVQVLLDCGDPGRRDEVLDPRARRSRVGPHRGAPALSDNDADTQPAVGGREWLRTVGREGACPMTSLVMGFVAFGLH